MVPAVFEFYRAAPSLIELHLLQVLAQCPNDSQSRIAQRAGIGLSVAHVYLHRLNIAGLVEFRGPSDKKILYTVTDAGRQHMAGLQARHFEALMQFVAEAGHRISLALEQAHADGFGRVGVLGGEEELRAAAGAAQALGIQVVPLDNEDLEREAGHARPGRLPGAVLIAANPCRSDVAVSIARLNALGVRCYAAATAEAAGGEQAGAAAAPSLGPLRSVPGRCDAEAGRAAR